MSFQPYFSFLIDVGGAFAGGVTDVGINDGMLSFMALRCDCVTSFMLVMSSMLCSACEAYRPKSEIDPRW